MTDIHCPLMQALGGYSICVLCFTTEDRWLTAVSGQINVSA
jgi:hypothetical protein